MIRSDMNNLFNNPITNRRDFDNQLISRILHGTGTEEKKGIKKEKPVTFEQPISQDVAEVVENIAQATEKEKTAFLKEHPEVCGRKIGKMVVKAMLRTMQDINLKLMSLPAVGSLGFIAAMTTEKMLAVTGYSPSYPSSMPQYGLKPFDQLPSIGGKPLQYSPSYPSSLPQYGLKPFDQLPSMTDAVPKETKEVDMSSPKGLNDFIMWGLENDPRNNIGKAGNK